jgi:putative sigma-54 modulation protein
MVYAGVAVGERSCPLVTKVTGRHMEITEPIRELAQKRAEKFGKYLERIDTVDVLTEKRGPHTYWVEFVVHAPGFEPFVASVKEEDLYAAIDECATKIERQVREFHAKLVDHTHKK